MPTPPSPTNPKLPAAPSQQPGAENAAHSPIDEQLHGFWKKNGQALIVLCGLVLLFYIGRAGWDYFATQKEEGTRKEFAEATTPEKLQAFAVAHPDHVLGGVAQLMVADADSKAGRMTAAISDYNRASDLLKTGPLAARARMGLAMAKIQSGDRTGGEASLHQLADDARQYQAIRAEALYQLASLAASANRGDEVQRLAAQLLQIDPNSPWAQQAFALEAEVPPPAVRTAPPALLARPPVTVKPAGP